MALIALHDLNLSVVLIFPCSHSISATAFTTVFAKAISYTPNKFLLLSPTWLASSCPSILCLNVIF